MPFDASSEYTNALGLAPESYAIMQELLAWLNAGGDDKCEFRYWIWNCGTHACIGGWLERRLFGGRVSPCPDGAYSQIADRLGMSRDHAWDLFFSGPYDITPRGGCTSPITASVAARCVPTLLATGRVDWPRAIAEEAR